jgi:hypothetical protein
MPPQTVLDTGPDPDTRSWVDSKLTAVLMGSGVSPLLATGAGLPLVTWLMWGAVDQRGLVLWASTTGVFLLFRFYVFWDYQRRFADAGVQARVVTVHPPSQAAESLIASAPIFLSGQALASREFQTSARRVAPDRAGVPRTHRQTLGLRG